MQITNTQDIPFVFQVWLTSDNYDYVSGSRYVSATTLLKSTKQVILGSRMNEVDVTTDLETFIARKLGDSIHEGIESAWLNNLDQALKTLNREDLKGIFVVNPKEGTDLKNKIPVYIEQRATKKIDGFTVGGKFDFVAGGVLHDFKSTSVWTWIKGNRADDYIKQGSIYRWLNPDKITSDFLRICYVFTDWTKKDVDKIAGYPPCKLMSKEYPLLSLEETEKMVKEKLAELDRNWDLSEKDMPMCTDEELWRTETVYKYYANAAKMDRATKNFSSMADAVAFRTSKGGSGVIVKVDGEPRACGYCSAAPLCQQKRLYTKDKD